MFEKIFLVAGHGGGKNLLKHHLRAKKKSEQTTDRLLNTSPNQPK